MLTLQNTLAPVYTPTGERDWDAEDAAWLAARDAARAETRRLARWYGLALAGMDRLHNNRRTVETIRRDFAMHLAVLAKFDAIAADALRREVSDLMARRDEHGGEPVAIRPDPTSDPDAAFECGYELAAAGRENVHPAIGYDCYERRAFYLGMRAAAVDLEAEMER